MLFRPARASDLDAICALLATAKRGPDYFHALFTSDPTFDPGQIHLAWTGGHIIACAKIYPRVLRIGTVVMPAGGVGNVRTDPRHWHKGLATSLLSECLSAMYLDGMALAPLFSSRHTLFARRGWHAIPEVQLQIPARALATVAVDAAQTVVQVRAFDGHDLDAVMALHEAANAARTGSALRERDDWLSRLTTLDLQGAVPLVAERDAEIVGFAWARPRGQTVEVLEMLLAPWSEDAWAPLLQGVMARFGDATTLCANLPADYRRLIGHALAPHVTTVVGDDLMLRIVDPARLLHGLVPLLSARLRDAGGAVPLTVRIGPLRGGAVLRLEHETIAVDHPRRDDEHVLPAGVFLALLLGVESAREHLDAVPLPDAARETILRLFPAQDWVFWRSDAF